MPNSIASLSALIFLSGLSAVVHAQENSATANKALQLKTVVVAPKSPSESVIAVPPATSVTFALNGKQQAPKGDHIDLKSWLSAQAALNGLQSPDVRPWHIVIGFDRFDEDGDEVQSGTFEEYWAGPHKYKRTYRSPDFAQSDFGTDKGLFRLGNQRWPNSAEAQVRAEVLDPFAYAATLQDVRASAVDRSFNGYKLRCTLVEKNLGVSDPTQYCFELDSTILRYSRGEGWSQTVYNRIMTFQGRNIAQDVDVTNGGKPYLKLRVQSIELLSQIDDALFHQSADAVGPLGDRITGVSATLIKSAPPNWPASLRNQHFTVTVNIVIGKDGHVISAHGISGPPEAYKPCEDAVRKWIFKPYIVLDRPAEVEQKAACTAN